MSHNKYSANLNWPLIAIVTLAVFVVGMFAIAITMAERPDEPAETHVYCVGKYLVFENLESHDIEVAGPCSK